MIKRQARQIHIGDKNFLDSRQVQMEFLGQAVDPDDEMATLAHLSFEVDVAERDRLIEIGLLEGDGCPNSASGRWRLQFRTDGDLLDEEEEALTEEWEDTNEDPSSPLGVWCDLEYWELLAVTAV